MQINVIYRRSMIQTIAGKAIRDLRSGGERELRNVVELFRGLAAPPEYHQFWDMLEDILHLPGQQYGALLSRTARDVDFGCLKTLIANLGLHAYTGGGEALRNGWASGTSCAYWLEALDSAQGPDQLHGTIAAFQEQGTSSFLLRVEQEDQLPIALDIAAKHRQCIFFFLCRPASCCQASLEEMAALGNVVPLICSQNLPALAGELKQAGLFFGFYRRYDEIESLESEVSLLSQWINAGCFLGVYEGRSSDPQNDDGLDYYAKLQQIRQKGSREILLSDLWRDREVVQKLLLHQQTLPDCSWNGKTAKKSR